MRPPERTPICLFIPQFLPGGTERQLLALAEQLDRSRYRLLIACFRHEGPWRGRAESVAESIEAFPLRSFGHLSTVPQLFRFASWCHRERLQIVQTADYYGNVFGLIGAALAGVPIRIGGRRGLGDVRAARQLRLQRLAYRTAHRIVANSRAAADRLRLENVPADRIVVVPNGVDGRLPPRKPKKRPWVILTVARLRSEKTVDVAVEAMARLPAGHKAVELWIAGDGPERARLQALVSERQLADRVSFLGHREDVPELLRQADAFVLSSRTEGSPNALLEAMAAGLPCVATNVGGVPELIEHGRTGLLVPPDDPDTLARALAGLLSVPERAVAMGDAARAATADFSFDRMARRFEAIYEQELARLSSTCPQPVGTTLP